MQYVAHRSNDLYAESADRSEANYLATEMEQLASFMIRVDDHGTKTLLQDSAKLLRIQHTMIMQLKKESADAKAKHRRKKNKYRPPGGRGR